MIIGQFSAVAEQKNVLPAAIVRALEALQKLDLTKVEPGRHELEGDKLYYRIYELKLCAAADSQPEAHRNYVDIQFPISGPERYGFALPQADLEPLKDSYAEKDLAFYPVPANETLIDAVPGTYLVFMPGELHRSGIVISEKAKVLKGVVKIHRSLLGL